MTTSTPDLDVVVYGATGFTGRLVCDHLATRDDVRWGIAGRSAQRLGAVADELDRPELPIIVADSGDPDSLAAMAATTKVVLTTVGPYATHGEPVVAACAETGTDYVDLTGEAQWIRRMIDRYHDAAAASGARIVHCCGFDSIPSDLGTLVAQATMRERHGVHASDVRLRVKAIRGGASGGTIASMVTMLEEAAADPSVARELQDPYALLPAGERIGPHVRGRTSVTHDDHFEQWVGPFVMELINAKVVRRSNALLGYPGGREFRYGEGVLLGAGLAGRAAATAMAAALGGGVGALTLGPVRALADRFLPAAGSGPDLEARENGFFDVRVVASHPTDRAKDVEVKVTADRDPGYGATSRMISEAALCLAADEPEVGGGSWTPASALGHALVERLEAHAGMAFEVVDR